MQKAPDAFRTISEAAELLDVPQHVLRFWETRFSQIRPMKRAGGRRYYRPQDIDLLRGIRTLLYDEGYTIKGVQKILRQHGVKHVIAVGRGELAIAPVGGQALARPATPASSSAGQKGNVVAALESVGERMPPQSAAGLSGTRGAGVSGKLERELRKVLTQLEETRALLEEAVSEADPQEIDT